MLCEWGMERSHACCSPVSPRHARAFSLSPLPSLFFFSGEQQRKRFVATVVQRETSTFVFFLTFFLICAHLGIY